MPVYQNSSVDTDKLVLGNYKIETAATSGGTFVNLGAGTVTRFAHVLTKYDTQAGNAPDPIEGIATETIEVDFELIEYDGSVLSAIQAGAISESNTTVLSTITFGGQGPDLTPVAFRLTNTRTINSSTVETILTLYKGTMANGLEFTVKSDNDTDPIEIMPGQIIAKQDSANSNNIGTLTHTIV